MKEPISPSADHSLSDVMYHWRVRSVHKMLALQGKAEGPLSVADLTALGHLDQYHYLGEQTCYEIVDALELQPDTHVCDIGSGVGGTSRVIAESSGCRVTAIELQEPLHVLAEELTRRTGLQEQISYICGSFMDYAPEEPFDHFISLLVFLHIPGRKRVLQQCYELLRPGGSFFIEDLVQRKPFSPEEQQVLRETVSAPSVSTPEAYHQDLQEAGFSELAMTDMSEVWTDWCRRRYQNFLRDEAFNRPFFGDEIYTQRSRFYRSICQLFEEGNLGGVRISGKRA